MVGTGWAEQIRILTLAIFVPGAHDRRTISIAKQQGLPAPPDRVDLVVEGVAMTGREGRVAKHLRRGPCRHSEQLLQDTIGSWDGMDGVQQHHQVQQSRRQAETEEPHSG